MDARPAGDNRPVTTVHTCEPAPVLSGLALYFEQ
jgi:hypothetical protein